MHRRELKNAPYNPRKIDKRARDKLKAGLKKTGLVNALVWNQQTGYIVGGHQRIKLLDELEQTDDYLLDVDVIDVPPEREREILVFLNNPTTQGDYDVTALAVLLKDDSFDKKLAGFDRLDLEVLYSDDELGRMFKADKVTEQAIAELAAVGGIKAERQAPSEPIGEPPSDEPGDGGDEDDEDTEPMDPEEEASAQGPVQRRSDAVKAFMHGKDAGNDTETYAVVVFETRREREIFMAACGQDPNTRYIDGIRVYAKMGIDPEGAEWAKLFDNPNAAPAT